MFNKTDCGCGCCFRLRPVAFGLALGLTAMLMSLLLPLGGAFGVGGMAGAGIQIDMWRMGFMAAGFGFAQGFLFGLVSAIFYNLFLCCAHCCKKKSENESCNISDKPSL